MVRAGGSIVLSFAVVIGLIPALPAARAAASEPVPAAIPSSVRPPEGARPAAANPVPPSKGTPWAWGWNGSGTLGNNATVQQNTPVSAFGWNALVQVGVKTVIGVEATAVSLISQGQTDISSPGTQEALLTSAAVSYIGAKIDWASSGILKNDYAIASAAVGLAVGTAQESATQLAVDPFGTAIVASEYWSQASTTWSTPADYSGGGSELFAP